MTIEQAKIYIYLSANNGYISEELVEELMKKPDGEIIKWAKENGDKGDYYANEL